MENTGHHKQLGAAHLRCARPTDRMEEVVDFYCQALGFQVLGRFQNHDGFDGVMLGCADAGYHLEFTTQRGHVPDITPSPDQLLVFYLPDNADWLVAVEKIEATGASAVESLNPYWGTCGRTYEDPDGYRIVIQNASWAPDL